MSIATQVLEGVAIRVKPSRFPCCRFFGAGLSCFAPCRSLDRTCCCGQENCHNLSGEGPMTTRDAREVRSILKHGFQDLSHPSCLFRASPEVVANKVALRSSALALAVCWLFSIYRARFRLGSLFCAFCETDVGRCGQNKRTPWWVQKVCEVGVCLCARAGVL